MSADIAQSGETIYTGKWELVVKVAQAPNDLAGLAVDFFHPPGCSDNDVSIPVQIDGIQMDDRDTKGDLYEYLLSKIATAGTNGQFRTPRHIIKMMVLEVFHII